MAALTGPRQSGKSTLALRLQDSGVVPNYFTLDDEPTRRRAREDPDGFALSLPRPATIDEIQRVPDLMLSIKQIVDRDQAPGQFLITGSADLVTARSIADALPGRVEYVNLWPLSQAEMAGRTDSVIDDLLAGSPPKIYAPRRDVRQPPTSSLPGVFLAPSLCPLVVVLDSSTPTYKPSSDETFRRSARSGSTHRTSSR